MNKKRMFKHLTWNDRLKIEKALKAKIPVSQLAASLRVSRTTIYNELKRGQYNHLNYDYTQETRYSPDIAQHRYRQNLKAKGPDLKIGNDHELVTHIENKILHDKYSPAAVLGEIFIKEMKFKTSITTRTLYSYIDKGLFLNLTNKALPMRGKRKQKYKRVRTAKRASRGTSIEQRSKHIENRKEYGHWELDLLQGKQNTRENILVLTERMTREQIMKKLSNKKSQTVINAINSIERKYSKSFKDKFKTITVDNGSEFSDYKSIEQSVLRNRKRTKVYYCHPYSAFERGSNEKQNQIIRRFFPKGTSFKYVTQKRITEVQDWLNNYPRKIFGYKSANDMLQLVQFD